ncbi:MAG TPA: FtsX-like permease family protein, partial [Candidatus Dormibacteraeota bacterium]|nr:FtsX-like permease family protein [Candidatus Dormibacteraeota bacterium]
MTALVWVAGLVRRRPLRVAGAAAGVMVAVALLASIGAFLSSAKAAMTTHAASSVAVDWQVKTAAGTRPVLAALAATPGVRAAQPVDFAAVDGFTASVGGSVQTTGAGYVLGLPPGYRSAFLGEIRTLAGSDRGVLLFQQTAANLHARPGDTVSVAAPGVAAPVRFRVDGVVDLPQEDSLFQKVGAPPGAQPSAPPDNVVLVPAARWAAAFAGLAAARPDRVEHQVHVGLRRGRLPADPTGAYTYVTGAAHNLEARLAGAGVVGDNLGRALDAARSDALYAQILFLLLGVPGAALAGGITAAATASGADRRRHEQALLRTRGATRAQLGGLALAEAGVVGLVGAAVGLGVAAGIGAAAFGSPTFGATPVSSAAWALGAAGAGLAIAALTVAVPAYRDASGASVAAARRLVDRYRTPLWCRYGLDVLALAAAAAIGWWVTSAGYQLVLAPEGVPSISVSYWALLGPALAWAGLGLLAWRLASGALARGGAALAFLLRPFSAGLAPTVISSLRRQRRRLATATTMVALAGA